MNAAMDIFSFKLNLRKWISLPKNFKSSWLENSICTTVQHYQEPSSPITWGETEFLQHSKERKKPWNIETRESIQIFWGKLYLFSPWLWLPLQYRLLTLVYGTKLLCSCWQHRACRKSKDTTALSKPLHLNTGQKTWQFFPALFSYNLEKALLHWPKKASYYTHAMLVLRSSGNSDKTIQFRNRYLNNETLHLQRGSCY